MNEDPPTSRRLALQDLTCLQLLQLTDSSFPIGALAHSFGLESLASVRLLSTADVQAFLRGYLEEAGVVEAVCCREAFQLARESQTRLPIARWLNLNELLAALKPGREARAGSAALGCNFLRAVLALGEFEILRQALDAAEEFGRRGSSACLSGVIEHSPAFGLVAAALDFAEEPAVLACLHQLASSAISAFQRLLPLGQTHATRILWNLKSVMI